MFFFRFFVLTNAPIEKCWECIRLRPSLSIFDKRSFGTGCASIVGIISDDKVYEEPKTWVAPILCEQNSASIPMSNPLKRGMACSISRLIRLCTIFSCHGRRDVKNIAKSFYYGANQGMTHHPFFGLNLY